MRFDFLEGAYGTLLSFDMACLAFYVRKVVVEPGFMIVLLVFSKWCCTECLAIMEEPVVDLYVQLYNSFAGPCCVGRYSCNLSLSFPLPIIRVFSGLRICFLSIQSRCVFGDWPRFLWIKCMSMPLPRSIVISCGRQFVFKNLSGSFKCKLFDGVEASSK